MQTMQSDLILPPSLDDPILPGLFEHLVLQHVGADISGADRGTNEFEDVITQTLDGADLNAMWREFQRVIALWNRDRSAIINALTFGVTEIVEQVRYPVEEDFEEATEFGVPKGIRLGPAFNMGYDFKWYDIAIRYTWLFLAESTAQQVRGLTNSALEADNRLMFTKVLRAIFNNVNRVATINEQAVNVYPFYNNDGTTPPKYHGTEFASTHNHYLTSGAATIDSGDLDTIEEHLRHHGYNVTGGYKLVVMVNRAQGDVIRTFRVADGDKYDFIPGPGYGGGVILQQGRLINQPTGGLSGLLEIGTYGPFIIIEDDYIPAGYVLSFATGSGGAGRTGNPVGIREHQRTELRGLKLLSGERHGYPLVDSFYQHGFGTGVRHRGAGVVMQITAAGSYTIPTAYQ